MIIFYYFFFLILKYTIVGISCLTIFFCKYENIQGRGRVNFLLWHRVASVSDYPQCGRNGGGVSHWYVSSVGCSWFTVPIYTQVCFRLYQCQWIYFGFSITHKLWLFSSYGNSLCQFHPLLKLPAPPSSTLLYFSFSQCENSLSQFQPLLKLPTFLFIHIFVVFLNFNLCLTIVNKVRNKQIKNYPWIFQKKCSVPLFYLSLYSVEQLHEFLCSWGGGGRLIRGWNCGRWEEALFMGLGLVTLCQWNLLKMKAMPWSC